MSMFVVLPSAQEEQTRIESMSKEALQKELSVLISRQQFFTLTHKIQHQRHITCVSKRLQTFESTLVKTLIHALEDQNPQQIVQKVRHKLQTLPDEVMDDLWLLYLENGIHYVRDLLL